PYSAFNPSLQCLVHLLKAFKRAVVQTFRKEPYEYPAEVFPLNEPDTVVADILDPKIVLAVEQAGHQQPAQPTKFAVFFRFQDRRLKNHAFAARGLNEYPQPLSLDWLTLKFLNERVPAWVSIEIGQHLPHPLRRGVYLYFGLKVFLHFSIATSTSSADNRVWIADGSISTKHPRLPPFKNILSRSKTLFATHTAILVLTPNGDVPPTIYPVSFCARSGVAGSTDFTPKCRARFFVETSRSPCINTISGFFSFVSNTSVFTTE